MLHYSPTSLRVILKLLRAGANKSLGECLQMEYDLVQKFMVRCQIGVMSGWCSPGTVSQILQLLTPLKFTRPLRISMKVSMLS
jgi:Enoyl-CoA hydratase/isomerase